ncbi:hypothetical protein PInf_014842 [Phytophthora infestans]|nr:hypothetical protein PInf_014832 [Phytophthora infestans]KAI9992904.1 hypothetical protein PInf_014842 [Phytophthora infestans]
MGEIAFDEEEELDFALDSSRSGEDSGEATDAATSYPTVGTAAPSKRSTRAPLASEDEKAKYQYKMQRLQFEREQEDQKRVHGAAEAEKRRAHELQLEDRRLQSDAARDKRMQEFILKVLEQQKQ